MGAVRQPTSGKLSIGARAQYFLAADVATRTLWFTAMALFYFRRYSERVMIGKVLVIIGGASAMALIVMLNTTTPASAGAFGILMVFVLAYLLTMSITTFSLYGISRLIAYSVRSIAMRKPVEVLSLQRAYYYATIISLAPIIIISMQSVGGVGVYELFLILLFIALGCVYVTKRTAH